MGMEGSGPRRGNGCVVADQLRTVDKVRMVRRLGGLSPATITQVLDLLQRMFAP